LCVYVFVWVLRERNDVETFERVCDRVGPQLSQLSKREKERKRERESMATGDVLNNLRRLQRAMRAVRYGSHLDIAG
jgi:hypothetical protein